MGDGVGSDVWRCEGGRGDGSLCSGPPEQTVSGVCLQNKSENKQTTVWVVSSGTGTYSTTSRETTSATLTSVGLSELPVEEESRENTHSAVLVTCTPPGRSSAVAGATVRPFPTSLHRSHSPIPSLVLYSPQTLPLLENGVLIRAHRFQLTRTLRSSHRKTIVLEQCFEHKGSK